MSKNTDPTQGNDLDQRLSPTPRCGGELVPVPTAELLIDRCLPVCRAMQSILALDAEALLLVMAAASAVRPQVAEDLIAAFDHEADRFKGLAERLRQASRHLRHISNQDTSATALSDRGHDTGEPSPRCPSSAAHPSHDKA